MVSRRGEEKKKKGPSSPLKKKRHQESGQARGGREKVAFRKQEKGHVAQKLAAGRNSQKKKKRGIEATLYGKSARREKATRSEYGGRTPTKGGKGGGGSNQKEVFPLYKALPPAGAKKGERGKSHLFEKRIKGREYLQRPGREKKKRENKEGGKPLLTY